MKIKISLLFFIFFIVFENLKAQLITKNFADDSLTIEFEFEGKIDSGDTIKHGDFRHFFEYSKSIYEEGKYKNNLKDGMFITYFENGEKHWVRFYQNENLIGIDSFFNQEGTLIFTGDYKKINENESHYTEYFPDGKIKKSVGIKNNLYHNKEITYSEQGDTLSIKNFKNGQLDGPFSIYKNGILLQSGIYRKDYLEDTIRTFYETGVLQSIGYFSLGVPNGEMKNYYPSGELKRQCFYSNDTLNGRCEVYYQNGQLYSEATFFRGFFDGLYLEYHENGKLKESTNYTKSQKNGTSKHYNEQGILISFENFKNGIYHGQQLRYFDDGVLESDFHYKDGHKTGENYRYFNDGTLASTLIFNTEDLIIEQKEYYLNDQQLKSITKHKYKNHKDKTTHFAVEKFYHHNGTLACKGKYLDGKKEGKWIYFSENKKLFKEENYRLDKLHGEYLEYYPNKKINTKGSYFSGKKSGVWTKFANDGELIQKSEYKNDFLDGAYYEKQDNGQVVKGNYKKGLKHGVWIVSKDDQILAENKYLKGEIIK